MRHDGGHADSGYGLDLGGGLAWSEPSLGLSAELAARGLLTRRFDGFRDLGLSGSLAWDPDPASERGPTLTVTQTLGGSATGGTRALLGRETLAGSGGHRRRAAAAPPGTARRLRPRGIRRPRHGHPRKSAWRWSRRGREYRVGVRIAVADRGTAWFEIGLEGTRREHTNPRRGPGARPRHPRDRALGRPGRPMTVAERLGEG